MPRATVVLASKVSRGKWEDCLSSPISVADSDAVELYFFLFSFLVFFSFF